eukprot:SM000045S16188  [mRNA]  locus=s45:112505:113235:- [translate_table: standard]
MTASGRPAGLLRVRFSAAVAASSLLYATVCAAYWARACPLMAALFAAVTVTSLAADSLWPASRAWCCADRSVATVGVVLGPLRSALFFSSTLWLQLEIVGLTVFSLCFLAWSRTSRKQAQFLLRHTCWHVVSAACLHWLAYRAPPVAPLAIYS